VIVEKGQIVSIQFCPKDAVGNHLFDLEDHFAEWIWLHRGNQAIAAIKDLAYVTITESLGWSNFYFLNIDTSHADVIPGIYSGLYHDVEGVHASFPCDGIDFEVGPVNVVAKIAGATIEEIEDEDGMLANAEATLTAMKGAGWTDETLKAIKDAVDTTTGAGASEQTITIKDGDGNPIADADVWITSDAAGTIVVYGTKQTDSDGHPDPQPMLDAGVTYYLWMQKDGCNPINGKEFEAE
jgi:hypothetical protein